MAACKPVPGAKAVKSPSGIVNNPNSIKTKQGYLYSAPKKGKLTKRGTKKMSGAKYA